MFWGSVSGRKVEVACPSQARLHPLLLHPTTSLYLALGGEDKAKVDLGVRGQGSWRQDLGECAAPLGDLGDQVKRAPRRSGTPWPALPS